MADVAILHTARARLVRGWCKRWSATNAAGDGCMPDAPEAACWCLVSAISFAVHEHTPPRAWAAHNIIVAEHCEVLADCYVRKVAGDEHTPARSLLASWQDRPDVTLHHVLDALDHGIAVLE